VVNFWSVGNGESVAGPSGITGMSHNWNWYRKLWPVYLGSVYTEGTLELMCLQFLKHSEGWKYPAQSSGFTTIPNITRKTLFSFCVLVV